MDVATPAAGNTSLSSDPHPARPWEAGRQVLQNQLGPPFSLPPTQPWHPLSLQSPPLLREHTVQGYSWPAALVLLWVFEGLQVEEIKLCWKKGKENWAWGVVIPMPKAPCPGPGANGSLRSHPDPEIGKGSLKTMLRPREIGNPPFFSWQHCHDKEPSQRQPSSAPQAHGVGVAPLALPCCRTLPEPPNLS